MSVLRGKFAIFRYCCNSSRDFDTLCNLLQLLTKYRVTCYFNKLPHNNENINAYDIKVSRVVLMIEKRQHDKSSTASFNQTDELSVKYTE